LFRYISLILGCKALEWLESPGSGTLDTRHDRVNRAVKSNRTPMPPQYAVIIPHYNDTARLRRCLTALVSGQLSGTDVIVVDNGSTEDVGFVSREFPSIRLVTENGKGAALARNRGVAETSAPHLIFLDADCVPAQGWLDAAKRAAARADIVGGAIDVFDETPPPRTGPEAFETVFAFNYREYIEKKGFSVTANLVTSRAVFKDVGGFINGLSEDAEWCFRAAAKGYRVTLDEGLRVGHPSRATWEQLRRKWHRIAREMFALHQTEWQGTKGRLIWAARALAMLASIPLHTARILTSPKLDGWGERLRGIGTLARLRAQRCVWMLRQAVGLGV
jgi:GT2 family glycosyltransferase